MPGAVRTLSTSHAGVFPTVQPATLQTVRELSVSPVPWAVTPAPSQTSASPAPQAGHHWTVCAPLLLPSSASLASTEVVGPVWPATQTVGPAPALARRTALAAILTTNSSDQPALLTVHQVRSQLGQLTD